MERTYKRKTQDKYSKDDLELALLDIRNKKLSIKSAAAYYHIPTRTIFHRLAGSRTGAGRGRRTILTKEEEYIVTTIILFQKWLCPISSSVVIGLAKPYMIQLSKPRWLKEIKLANTVKLEKVCSEACRKETVERWFEHLNVVLTKHKLLNNRPEAIWNVDESGFGDDPGKRSVIIKRDSKYAISSQPGTGKSYTTVIMCTSASGEKLPPYIIYRSMKLWSTWIPKNGYPGARYNATLSGWVEEEVFYDWFVNQFLPAVAHIKRRLIIFFDGHRAHISTRIVKKAMQIGIELECLPAHITTILQPLDVVTLNKISELWKNYVLKGHCSGDFAKAGIYPYEPRAISNEKLLEPSSSNDESTCVDDSAVIHQPVNRLTRSASCEQLSAMAENLFGVASPDAPVYTDLSNNNMVVMDNSLFATPVPINVLSNVISQYMGTSTTNTPSNQRKKRIDRHCGQSLTSVEVLAQLQAKEKVKQRKERASTKKTATSDKKESDHERPRKVTQQRQVLDEIDALSDLDPKSDFNITTSSTAIDSNRLTIDTNNDQHITTDPSHHVSFYDTQQQPQMFPSCYRCNTAIYGNFTNCNNCDRYCCQLCVQNYFFSHSITCEYCAMHQAIADFDSL
ncbi:unnamed protein product [Rotaria magnacalcarata]|uniref:DDE-1 domain-containing protein n=1 Tax=Rotaria magnacalcarata TaxID=392030 RepID=A0A816WQZ4_9BILA|nr:unnamed protein product [Rotaria magnacalcarata]